MKSKYWLYGIFALAIIGVVLISGCISQKQGPTCVEGWKCKNSTVQAFQRADCSWTQEKFCELGCENNICKTPPKTGIRARVGEAETVIGPSNKSEPAPEAFELIEVRPTSESEKNAPEVEWTKTFGKERSSELARAVHQTSDGGYILVGWSKKAGISDVYLVKTDSSGNLEWENKYGTEENGERGFSVQQTSDGGYIVAGVWGVMEKDEGLEDIGEVNSSVYLIKTDSNGNIEWEKTYGTKSEGRAVQETFDGGYVVVGYITSETGNQEYYLIKTDSNGNIEWEKTIGTKYKDLVRSVQQTSDGGYIVVGEAETGKGGLRADGKPRPTLDTYIVKTDPNGNVKWDKLIGEETGDERGYYVQQTSDGGYIIGGTVDPSGGNEDEADFYLLRLNPSGDVEWQKALGIDGIREWSYVVDVAPDGGYVLAGETQIGERGPNADLNVYIIRTDSSGNILWAKEVIGQTGPGLNDWARGVEFTSDGGVIAAGMTTFASGNKDVFLVKLRPE